MTELTAKGKTPAIRFKGFSGEWDEENLDDEVVFYSGLTYSPSNVVKRGGTFVLRSSNVKGGEVINADNVYVNSEVVNCDNVKVGDVIIVVRNGSRSLIGKHAQIKKTMPNTVIGAFMTGIHAKQSAFINVLLDTSQFNKEIEKNLGATINQITIGAFKTMRFWFPESKEQTQIGNFFQQLDRLIAQHQQKHDKLRCVKKALLTKMFPKQGKTQPAIRFKGFSEAWEEKALGEVVEVTTGKLDANAMEADGKYDFYTSGIKKYKINTPAFEGPAITVAGNGATVGYMYLADGKFNAYQRTYVLTNFTANRYFLFFQIGNVLPIKISQEARTGNIPYIVLDMLTELEVLLPVKKEQTKIGKLFQQLDTLINQQQSQLTKLNNIKQAMLAKMFV